MYSRRLSPLRVSILTVALLGHQWAFGGEERAAPDLKPLHFIDLTHEIPTFEPSSLDRTKPDLAKPIMGSTPVPGFGPQAILYPPDVFMTNQGYFNSASLFLQEHAGTHLNSLNHYINNVESMEPGGIPINQRKAVHELPIEQLAGPIVFIDVSMRVQAELAKNGGRPNVDARITDFSDRSQATVRAHDIDRVADQITDGVWVVARLGWDQFYPGGEDWDASPYVNGLNHPGFTREAIDRLIAIMDEKHVRISGITTDSFTCDSGQGAQGIDNNYSNAWPSHVRLYQRGVLSVENLANVGALAQAIGRGEKCSIAMGVLKHVGGTGGPVRAIAACQARTAAIRQRAEHR